MGLSLSITQNDEQSISNQISQISNEQCINVCTNDGSIDIDISGGKVEGINITDACFINSASCNLKSSLDSKLINSLSSKQKGDITDISGLFTLFDDLARIGGADDITQNNYQDISNQATQQMNSICLTPATENRPVVIDISGGNTGFINIDNSATISKSQCVIDNVSKFYAQNSEVNDQTAKILRFGIGLILALLAVLILAAFILHHHRNQHKLDLSDNPETLEAASKIEGGNNSQETLDTILKSSLRS